jgi:hypothetical protein
VAADADVDVDAAADAGVTETRNGCR